MICLLQSSAAALATHPRGGVGVGVGMAGSRSRCGFHFFSRSQDTASLDDESTYTSSTDKQQRPLLTTGHIAIRLARRTDVPQIQNCNLATLPENYNANFYVNHMRTWPELTLVAEHIPDGCSMVSEEDTVRVVGGRSGRDDNEITPLGDCIRGMDRSKLNRRGTNGSKNKPRKEIVGYILGKVEERPINPPPRQIFPPSRVVPLYDAEDAYNDEDTLLQYMNGNSNGSRLPSSRQQQPLPPKEKIGHVTSLAVHSHARRLGIASSLIHQLHFHLQECYNANSIGLHVRMSNKAAVGLYIEDGYDVADIIPLYYGDGEDAYFMRKDLLSVRGEEAAAMQREISQQQQQEMEQKLQPGQQQQKWRRGEKERNEWLNRDATRNGSFFDNRKSMRDTLSQEEKAWVNKTANPPISAMATSPSLSGQFKRSFRTFFNTGGEQPMQQQRRKQSQYQLPPWETGPEGLRLPRYSKVVRAPPENVAAATAAVEKSLTRGMSLKNLVVTVANKQKEDDDGFMESYKEEEEEDSLTLDNACAASGSV